jgi:ABC-2 type transport system permease protein
MIVKEFIQMRRDEVTLRLMLFIPVMQLILFGYAINSDPKNLPTAVIDNDNSVAAREVVAGMRNSGYFQIIGATDEHAAEKMLRTGKAQFVVNIPANFTRDILRGECPALLIEADATDPTATNMR